MFFLFQSVGVATLLTLIAVRLTPADPYSLTTGYRAASLEPSPPTGTPQIKTVRETVMQQKQCGVCEWVCTHTYKCTFAWYLGWKQGLMDTDLFIKR